MISIKFIFALMVVYLTSILAIYAIRPYAAKFFLEDIPKGRKQHKAPTPVIGGIGVVSGFIWLWCFLVIYHLKHLLFGLRHYFCFWLVCSTICMSLVPKSNFSRKALQHY